MPFKALLMQNNSNLDSSTRRQPWAVLVNTESPGTARWKGQACLREFLLEAQLPNQLLPTHDSHCGKHPGHSCRSRICCGSPTLPARSRPKGTRAPTLSVGLVCHRLNACGAEHGASGTLSMVTRTGSTIRFGNLPSRAGVSAYTLPLCSLHAPVNNKIMRSTKAYISVIVP